MAAERSSEEGKGVVRVKAARAHRSQWKQFCEVATRWIDNDIYGHINNVVYYSLFDTAIAHWLIDRGLFDPVSSEVIYLVVDSGCSYFESVSHPAILEIGIRADRIGRTSVTYSIGVFRKGSELAVARGHFVHVAVLRDNRTAVPLPSDLRSALSNL